MKKAFSILLILIVAQFLATELFSQKHAFVSDIRIIGNQHTKDAIIIRELPFRKGDFIEMESLEQLFRIGRDNLLNLSLFNFVFVTYIADASDLDNEHFNIEVVIRVDERWYYWPKLNFSLDEHNINTWIRDPDWSKFTAEAGISFNNLFEQNQACISKLRSLAVNQTDFKQIKEENNILRAQLNFVKAKKSFVTADVVGKEMGLSNVIIINRGEVSGLKIDQPVIAGEGFLVGKVVKVEKDMAFIRLLSDNQSKIAAAVLNKIKTMGVVSGEHGLSLNLGMVPQTEELDVGDEVVTSGLELKMPRGLLIGKIQTIQKQSYEPFQSAALEPFVGLSKLSIVTVLTD